MARAILVILAILQTTFQRASGMPCCPSDDFDPQVKASRARGADVFIIFYF